MKGTAKCFDELRAYVETVPLVDCHDHTGDYGPRYTDPLQVVASGYFLSDLYSVSCHDDIQYITDHRRPIEQRWPVFEKAWKQACHTGYAQVTRRLIKHFYHEDEMTLDALKRMADRLLDLEDGATFEKILDEANIVVRIGDIFYGYEQIIAGTCKLSPRCRIVINLAPFHGLCSRPQVDALLAPMKMSVTSLGDYIEGCREIFMRLESNGAIAFKDPSAYTRPLRYGNPTRAEAEEVFNWFMADPRRSVSYPDGVRPLDDYLFHTFMGMARDMDLPVQIHTGHMGGIRNDIVKTNAVLLTSVLELHRDVRFDLFHGSWPYSGEFIYLAKNFPNVRIDFCWANIIDPIYCHNLFKQALSAIPHGKIHGYGSDFVGCVDRAWAHAAIARDNIAIALSDMVRLEYLDVDEAKELAYAWLFGNPNAFFRLNL